MTYDENKRKIDLAKHGIDLAECESIFDLPMLTREDDRLSYGEKRLKSLSLFRGRVVTLIWTERDGEPHLISCRYGENYEYKEYFANNRFF